MTTDEAFLWSVDIDPADDALECDENNNDRVIGLLSCEEDRD